MGKDKVDLRILKTRKAIKEAFLTLIQTKGYERITIQDIANEAMINRNTFYLHYIDKIDLMEKLCQESIKNLDTCLSLYEMDLHKVDTVMFESMLRRMFQSIDSNIDFFKIMLSQKVEPSFNFYLKEELKKRIIAGVGSHYHDQKMKISLEYMVSGLVGVICLWITESENLVLDEVIAELSDIHFHNIMGLFI